MFLHLQLDEACNGAVNYNVMTAVVKCYIKWIVFAFLMNSLHVHGWTYSNLNEQKEQV